MNAMINPLTNSLFAAIEDNNFEEVSSLIAQGADVNATIEEGFTPLHHAVYYNIHRDKFTGDVEIIKLLIANGADVNAGNEKGFTPLHYASSYTKFDDITFYSEDGIPVRLEQGKLAMQLLLDSGANPNALDTEGRTPMDYARSIEASEILQANGGKFGAYIEKIVTESGAGNYYPITDCLVKEEVVPQLDGQVS